MTLTTYDKTHSTDTPHIQYIRNREQTCDTTVDDGKGKHTLGALVQSDSLLSPIG